MKLLSILLTEEEVLIRVNIWEILEKAGHFIAAECGDGQKAGIEGKGWRINGATLTLFESSLCNVADYSL
ncbi:MAG: hypothetical protein H6Q67_1256 [Firmicutes bacterium]|nr:hypothetical protein [Bacillota bacterium]